MKKIYFAAFALAVSLSAAAQDTYESARLLGSDLNGTARFVGMGGAMDALGADLSTISTNPAGIGLFRHSTINASMGLVSQQDVQKFDGLGKTNLSFDQAGFVYSIRTGGSSYFNFAFNYHKSRNFDQILSAVGTMKNTSSNLITKEKDSRGFYYLDLDKKGQWVGYESETSNYMAANYSQLDDLNANILGDEVLYKGEIEQWYFGMAGDSYNFDRSHRGWINNFDFCLSGNENDRFYWGVTAGIKDVRYKGYSEYAEGLVDINGQDGGIVAYGDRREIKGTGLDIKFGVIFRPIEESPFRIGLSVATPTWYTLKTNNTTALDNRSALGERVDHNGEIYNEPYGDIENSYKFKYYTPWKFSLSLGHTVGNYLALGAGIDYSDYGASKNRIDDGDDYDWYYDEYYERSHTDEVMKRHTENTLKGVATFKVGAELKPIPEMAVRLGYNYQTSPYESYGVRDQTLRSPGVSYASTSDYVNWEGTHRLTAGLGFRFGPMNLDLAYQYSGTNGTFYPFQTDLKPENSSYVNGCSVSNKRHQLLLTLGYTF